MLAIGSIILSSSKPTSSANQIRARAQPFISIYDDLPPTPTTVDKGKLEDASASPRAAVRPVSGGGLYGTVDSAESGSRRAMPAAPAHLQQAGAVNTKVSSEVSLNPDSVSADIASVFGQRPAADTSASSEFSNSVGSSGEVNASMAAQNDMFS